ncbi:MAG: PH domain-containing protein [bacterium]|nr:PH domain-containing protein [bacterium]
MANWIERLLRLPPTPAAPESSAGSARIFHASPKYYRLRLIRWAAGQFGAATGLVFALGLMTVLPLGWLDNIQFGPLSLGGLLSSRLVFGLEIWALIFFVVQLPVTLLLVRLDYTQRWYIVTDRSLRIREGLRTVREKTMTFANIQNLSIRQNPLQRLLGIADLHVQTAGGGGKTAHGSSDDGENEGESLHLAIFRGVDNAEVIRDLLLDHLKRMRASGLGDPDETPGQESAPPELPTAGEVSDRLGQAVREARREAAALRGLLRARGDAWPARQEE